MRASYLVHIVAGSLALLTGYVALFVVKGATVHRRAGILFVYAIDALVALARARRVRPRAVVATGMA